MSEGKWFWTDEEVATMARMRADRQTFDEISAILGRSRLACIRKAMEEGLTKKTPSKGPDGHPQFVIDRIVSLKGHASASVISGMVGLSRNAVIGIWRRHITLAEGRASAEGSVK